ncbi:MAG: hypothetical protein JKY48_08825 [Flavobacteriales bacterium]|nr:hypothetical protein [Flavobacteriales bacterium]
MNSPSQILLEQSIPNITFQQLISKIDNSKLLLELIANYENTISPLNKFQVQSIVPILQIRIQAIADSFDNTASFNKTCLTCIESLSKQSKSIHQLLHSILTIINAEDHSSALQQKASKLCEDFDAVDFTIQRMYLVFMDETFEEYSTDLDSMSKKYEKLTKMLDGDSNTTEWVIKQVNADLKELKDYAKEIALNPIKRSTLSTYQNTLPIYAEINDFCLQVNKTKSTNPLVSNELIVDVTTLNDKSNSLAQTFNQWINLIYRYDQQIQVVKENIKCFEIIADYISMKNETI